MNICELIEASSSQDTLESDQTHKEDDASSKAPDELGAQALTVTTSEGSTNPSATDAAASNEFTHNESFASGSSSTSDSVDSDSKNDDDEDNSVYNRMIMFVSSNENEYGDQENSSSNSGHDDDDYGSSSASKGGYGDNNNDEKQNLRQFLTGGGGNLGGIGNQSSQFSILSNPIEEECQFELLNHTERFFKLCENPTSSNM